MDFNRLFGVRMAKAAKGGPYIGPNGGKWADPEHTVHWEPERRKPATHSDKALDTIAGMGTEPSDWQLTPIDWVKEEREVVGDVKCPTCKGHKAVIIENGVVIPPPDPKDWKADFDYRNKAGGSRGRGNCPTCSVHKPGWGYMAQGTVKGRVKRMVTVGRPQFPPGHQFDSRFGSGSHCHLCNKSIYKSGMVPVHATGADGKVHAMMVGEDCAKKFLSIKLKRPEDSIMEVPDMPDMAPINKARMAKGGPYIGPKGGLWADPKHTVHWDSNTPRDLSHEKTTYKAVQAGAEAIQRHATEAQRETPTHAKVLTTLASRLWDEKPHHDIDASHPKHVVQGLRIAANAARASTQGELAVNTEMADHWDRYADEVEQSATAKKVKASKAIVPPGFEAIPIDADIISAIEVDVFDMIESYPGWTSDAEDLAAYDAFSKAVEGTPDSRFSGRLLVPTDPAEREKLRAATQWLLDIQSEAAENAPVKNSDGHEKRFLLRAMKALGALAAKLSLPAKAMAKAGEFDAIFSKR